MADGGLDDILISYNLIGEEKMARLGALMRRVNMTVVADNPTVVAGLPRRGRAGRSARCRSRSNATPGASVRASRHPRKRSRWRNRLPQVKGLSFAGFMMYPTESGWPEAQAFYDEALQGVREAGLEPTMVSTGGSPNLKNLGKLKGATEHRPGTYIYNDRMQVAAGVATLDDCALHIYSTVVSRAAADRGILDAGSKTLTSDPGGGLDGYGLILEHPEAKIARFAEEHGFLDLARSNTRPNVGDVVRIVPNHVCVVVNMVDEVVMVRGDEIVGTLPVAARGKLRVEFMRLPFFYGWIIVAVTFVTMGIGVNARTFFSLLFSPIIDEFGWPRGMTAGAFSFGFVMSAIFSPMIGRLMDRTGPRTVMELGVVMMAGGLLLAPLTSQPWHLYLTIGFLVGAGSVCLGYSGQSLFLPNWFVRKRGLAVGIAFAGVGIGSITLLPWMQMLIEQAGWRTACWTLGLLLLVVLAPINLLLRKRPQDMGLQPDGDAAPAANAERARTWSITPGRRSTGRSRARCARNGSGGWRWLSSPASTAGTRCRSTRRSI